MMGFFRDDDVLGVVAIQAVKNEVRRIKLGHELRPFAFVPLVQLAVVLLKAPAGEVTRFDNRCVLKYLRR